MKQILDATQMSATALVTLAKAPPPISGKLRGILESFAAQRERHVLLMLQAIREAVPAYGAIVDPELMAQVRSMILINLEMWDRVLREQRPPSELDLAPVATFARRRYHQGIPLTALLHSFRSGANTIWRECLRTLANDREVQEEMLMSISPYLLEHTDLLGQALSHSYLDEAHRSRRWRDRRYQELCSLVLNTPEDQPRFEQLAGELQIDPHGRRAAMVIEPQGCLDMEVSGRDFDDMLQAVVEYLGLDQEPPNIIRQGQLLLWIPLAHGVNPLTQERQRLAQCGELVRLLPNQVRAVGLGLYRNEAVGWRASAEQAISALDRAYRAPPENVPQVYCYSDVVLEDCAVTPRFDAAFFEGMLALLADEPTLLETLQVWLNTPGLTRKSAAAVLDIHPNTLDYRLRKIEQRLGADLSDLSWLARLHVALRLRDRY